jgi:hypothetical protein
MVNSQSPDKDIREKARELYQFDGEVEIDGEAEISWVSLAIPMVTGVYVQAWVWVPFDEEAEDAV